MSLLNVQSVLRSVLILANGWGGSQFRPNTLAAKRSSILFCSITTQNASDSTLGLTNQLLHLAFRSFGHYLDGYRWLMWCFFSLDACATCLDSCSGICSCLYHVNSDQLLLARPLPLDRNNADGDGLSLAPCHTCNPPRMTKNNPVRIFWTTCATLGPELVLSNVWIKTT